MKKIIIIGGGPGGYVTAIKAAQAGFETHIVEDGKFGGTCLNVGCIPTKVLLHSALFYRDLKNGNIAGVCADHVRFDWKAVQQRKQEVTARLVNGVGGLLAANKVCVHQGKAVFTGPDTVAISGQTLPRADAIVIASGSMPIHIGFPGAKLPQVIDSTAALSLDKVPASLSIIGGGVIGVEFASVFNALGAAVTMIEMLPEILPPVDRQVAKRLRDTLEKDGVKVMTGAKLMKAEPGGDGKAVLTVETGNGIVEIPSEVVLMAAGRKPCTEDLGLEKAGVKTEGGAIIVDADFKTNVKGIFAIGDCNAKNMLAHAASAQGEAVINYLVHGKHDYDGNLVPGCIYTNPEIASVGLTEEAAKAAGIDYAVGAFDLSGNGKTLIDNGGVGMIKIIADKKTSEVLGVHMIGPHATEMIAEAVAVMRMEGLAEDIERTIHPHPTISEAVCEAAMAVFGNAVHWPPNNLKK